MSAAPYQRGTLENAYRIARALAFRVARQWRCPVWEPEDAEGVALTAAWQAWQSYDPTRGASLETWVSRRVWQTLQRERARVKLRAEDVALSEVLGYVLADPNPGPAECGMRAWEEEQVRAAVLTLPPAVQEVVRQHWWMGETYERIGKRLGITRSGAQQTARRATNRLRTRLVAVLGEETGR